MGVDNQEQRGWYQDTIGARLIDAERAELAGILPRLYGYHLVFMGDPGLTSLVRPSLIQHQILIDPEATAALSPLSRCEATLSALPLLSDSVDVVVLNHLLEHISDPHEVLREANRVLIPEGHLVITGFNPISWWGGWHAIQKWRKKVPPEGKMLSPNRLKDWLKLLNFQIVGGRTFCYRPPLRHEGLYEKLSFLDSWGERWCPYWGGAYTLVAVKRVIPLTPIKAKFRLKPKIWEPAPETIPKPTSTVYKKNP